MLLELLEFDNFREFLSVLLQLELMISMTLLLSVTSGITVVVLTLFSSRISGGLDAKVS